MKTCSLENCPGPARGLGYCSKHYMRNYRTGSPHTITGRAGEFNGRWAGGKASHPLTEVYWDMVRRCRNPKHFRYPSYGGRGIEVCQEWVDDFWQFVEDVRDRPDESKTPGGRAYWQLDRINNDGNYEPGNVRWATPKQQANNKRGFGDFESRRDSLTGRFT